MNKIFPAFPKIFNLGHKYILDIFEDEVEVTEKVDGSAFSLGKINGEVYIRSKGKQLFFDDFEKLFKEAVEYVKSIRDKIPDNTIFYCEYLKKPHHNVLYYDKIPKNHLALFGVCDDKFNFISKHEELKKYAELLDIDVVPLIYYGKIESPKQIEEMLNRKSYLGGANIEGVVIKNYNKSLLLTEKYYPIKAGKFVSEEFKEVHKRDWKKEYTSKGKFDKVKDCYRTEARWLKAIQHLRDIGELEYSCRDIGKLIKEIKKDIIEEEKEEIKEKLWNIFSGEILRHSTRGFPEWYKKYLLNRNFDIDNL